MLAVYALHYVDRDEDSRSGHEQATDEHDRLQTLNVEGFAHHVDAAHEEHEGNYKSKNVHASILPTSALTPKSPSPRRVPPCGAGNVPPILGTSRSPELILGGWIERHTRIAPRGRAPWTPPMSNTATQLPPFGWYPDPAGSHLLRWWDGKVWTNRLEKPRPELQAAKGYAQQQSTLSRLIAS